MASTPHTLPPLPYAYDALEPIISKQIMELHHQKHHQTYVNNLNAALSAQAEAVKTNNVSSILNLQQKLKFNGGGHINHSLFWKNLIPLSSPETVAASAAPTLVKAIVAQWGSLDSFITEFQAALLGIQGSGWGWLVSKRKAQGELSIVTTKDQDPVQEPDVPIFGIDMWEHAYYLQYLNNKAGYVTEIWKIINWAVADERYRIGVDSSNLLKAAI